MQHYTCTCAWFVCENKTKQIQMENPPTGLGLSKAAPTASSQFIPQIKRPHLLEDKAF